MRGVPVVLSFLLFLLTSSAVAGEIPPPTYSAQPIRGKVVDGTTGQPLEGVIIVAQWVLYRTTLGGENPHERLQVLETLTAQDGTYTFPAWGPKPNLPIVNLPLPIGYICCFLSDRDPELSILKPGYRMLTLRNQRRRDTMVRVSDWDGKIIKLEPFRGSLNEWATDLHFLQGSLLWSDLDWRMAPRMLLAIENERLRLPHKTDWSVSSLESLGTSREEILRALGK